MDYYIVKVELRGGGQDDFEVVADNPIDAELLAKITYDAEPMDKYRYGKTISVETSSECRCCGGIPSADFHTCPYKDDIYSDQSLCNCCEDCQHQCAMDI